MKEWLTIWVVGVWGIQAPNCRMNRRIRKTCHRTPAVCWGTVNRLQEKIVSYQVFVMGSKIFCQTSFRFVDFCIPYQRRLFKVLFQCLRNIWRRLYPRRLYKTGPLSKPGALLRWYGYVHLTSVSHGWLIDKAHTLPLGHCNSPFLIPLCSNHRLGHFSCSSVYLCPIHLTLVENLSLEHNLPSWNHCLHRQHCSIFIYQSPGPPQ